MYHRVIASIAVEMYKTNVDITLVSQSLLNKIMRYNEVTKNTYTRFGTNTAPLSQECYKNTQKLNHKNLIAKQCDFLVKQTYPHLGASSDNIVSYTCHNDRVLESKCPNNYQNEFKHWRNYKKFPLNFDGNFKENHPYYFQIQLQMFMHNLNDGHFLIIAQTITMKSTSQSICVSGTIFCSMRNFLTCPVTIST